MLSRLQTMAKYGLLHGKVAKCQIPFCSGCAYGKMTKKPWRTKVAPSSTPRVANQPGECVSVDQMEATVPGLIAQLKGLPTKKRYNCATIFVDHFSGLSYVHLQQALTSKETIQAKQAFESFAASHGVQIRHYHDDNGRFADNDFRQAVQGKRQTISFCGVNAHWQNGRAEKRIRDLTESARSMLLHAQRRWDDAITPNLWPYALRMANEMHNNLPTRGSPDSPIERFSRSNIRPQLRHYHHFGCPVYVLQGPLQQGQKIRKWSDRSRLGIYLGHSPLHAKSVALVLSLQTGNVSPQYHCQFDDYFESVTGEHKTFIPKSQWQHKTYFVTHKSAVTAAMNNEPTAQEQIHIPAQAALPPPREGPQENVPPTPEPQPMEQENLQGNEWEPPLLEIPQPRVEEDQNIRRSNRVRRPPTCFADYVPTEQVAFAAIVEPELDQFLALKIVSDPDTMYLWQARKEPDWPQFKKAMQEEIEAYTREGHWKIVLRSSVPRGTPILPAVWSMKRKRKIETREIYKWKACLTVDGSKQQYGLHCDQTYSPVVTWAATRFFLIQSILHSWHSRQLDFLLAYPQADIERDLYMELPKGVTVEGNTEDSSQYVLKLVKNLYGQNKPAASGTSTS
jgi:hypothetical protein